ncbi:hypothetical protein SKAU_G00248210 [Synaphobranchus kaupii]|uniref:Uncharacterized protein n=1 Tax=Synaphobranchus kaupii TaxID=118154 RepID=A0A9Q1F2G5_SYNKA|nr:hypothetical protein SKAU_G00248210 [Synaphobranchus kaupii]
MKIDYFICINYKCFLFNLKPASPVDYVIVRCHLYANEEKLIILCAAIHIIALCVNFYIDCPVTFIHHCNAYFVKKCFLLTLMCRYIRLELYERSQVSV